MAQGPVQQNAELRLTRVYPVPAEKVWRAWTDPQALSRWFGPADTESVTQAQLDVREGGTYSIRFRTADGEEHGVSGVYQAVEPQRKLVFSWAWQSTPERVSRVTVLLRTVQGGTELDFRHDRFFNDEARVNHARGWTGTFAKLDAWIGEP
ncbi:SRPBCC domain-containing protein [Caenimonas sedimenti]|uniref:SRPBCC domain-containing protein n=1 Tax=Caenimonas sedimenti TaxID=2596921 RepID=A0A562ZNF9_9BURK|nr:SRPBCC domain-containing protein [Caenimonas sedimenti]TWO69896.1 SRPBCC domain-containing protein [Caenimonas sedimenti]